jgi:hypothetical protein
MNNNRGRGKGSMKKKCIVPGCNNKGKNIQHVFSGRINIRPSLKPPYPCICNQHMNDLNHIMREFKKNNDITLNNPWTEAGKIGDNIVEGRKKMLDSSAGTFCTIGENIWEISVDNSHAINVNQMSQWYLFEQNDNKRHIAYALRLATGTTY